MAGPAACARTVSRTVKARRRGRDAGDEALLLQRDSTREMAGLDTSAARPALLRRVSALGERVRQDVPLPAAEAQRLQFSLMILRPERSILCA